MEVESLESEREVEPLELERKVDSLEERSCCFGIQIMLSKISSYDEIFFQQGFIFRS